MLNSNSISQGKKAQKMLTTVKVDTATFATEVPDVPEILTTEEISEEPNKRRSSQSVTSCREIDLQLISTITEVRSELPFLLESVPGVSHRNSSPKFERKYFRKQNCYGTVVFLRTLGRSGQQLRLRLLDIPSQSVREPSHQLS
jgi:hypothetical protein